MTNRIAVSIVGALMGGLLLAPPPALHPGGAGEQDGTPVASTARFRFHSDFRMNLHDYLYYTARRDTTRGAVVIDRCGQAVGAAAADGWLGAVTVYRDSLARLGGFDRPVLDIRFVLSGLPGHGMTLPPWLNPVLADAEGVFRACVWPELDRRNREWVAAVVPFVERFEERIVSRLETLYDATWESSPIRVDLVHYVGRTGANTVIGPSHILIGSSNPNYRGQNGLEMVFHEASHTLIGARRGGIIGVLRDVAEERGVTLHRDLWHVLLFYTTGMVTKQISDAELGSEYEPYLYSTGLFDRVWPELRDAVEQYWTPYVEGRQSVDEAVRNLVAAFER